ncbi:hypothetical protein WJX73_008805 [Symbiochloris irregularis]|uniref:Sigma 54 modulation/S30EA ribosomal protein C-terminal domain-containing protein n=1 Tax=Symbiochloris irregularis TaxID=706552 RepID=A0AAW1NMC0_9CHLO
MLGGLLMFQLRLQPQSGPRGQQSPCRVERNLLLGQLIPARTPHGKPLKPFDRRDNRLVVRAAAPTSSSVKILIQGRHVQVTESIDAYVREKVAKSTHRYESAIRKVDVKLSVRGGSDRGAGPKEHLAEVTIFTLRNGVVRVEDKEDNMYASIDLVCDKLARKMGRVKDHAISVGKWHGRERGSESAASFADSTASLDEDEAAEDSPYADFDSDEYGTPLPQNIEAFDAKRQSISNAPADLLRQKEFFLQPMTLTEAILSLDQVGHDFFVFQEEKSKQVQVLYRRREEGYGVIIPHTVPANK